MEKKVISRSFIVYAFLLCQKEKKKEVEQQERVRTIRLKKDTSINSCPPIKLRLCDDDSMKQVMEMVKGGLMGVNQAARNFEVPRTTLRDHLSGAWSPDPYLTKEEEQDVVDFLKQATRIGLVKAKGILVIVHKLLQTRCIEKNVSLSLLCSDYVSIVASISTFLCTETEVLIQRSQTTYYTYIFTLFLCYIQQLLV